MEKIPSGLSFQNVNSARQATSSAMASEFASVSVMASASNSVFNPFTNSSNSSSSSSTSSNLLLTSSLAASSTYAVRNSSAHVEVDRRKNSGSETLSSNLLKGLSLSKAASLLTSLPSQIPSAPFSPQQKQNQTDTETNQQYLSSSTLSSSITATASSVLNNFKLNPFELNNSENKNQKQRQSLFSKFESTSISISTAFGYSGIEIDDTKSDTPNRSNKYDKYDLEMLDQSNNNSRNNSESGSTISTFGSIKRKSKPIGTVDYVVESEDTIEKIALKWNTIPSEIQHLNRLSTRVIFPGQILFVPDPNYIPPSIPTTPTTASSSPKPHVPVSILNELNNSDQCQNQSTASGGFGIFKWKPNTNPKPGHAEQQTSSNNESSQNMNEQRGRANSFSRHVITEQEAKQLDEECMQRFLKINCKIITRSKGSYEGVLIITPSAVMFDPFDTDTNNKKNENFRTYSSSSYASTIYDEASAIIPIEIISNVIMYEDLALKDVHEYFDYQHSQEILESDLITTEDRTNSQNLVTFDLTQEEDSSKELNQLSINLMSEKGQEIDSKLNNSQRCEDAKTNLNEKDDVFADENQSSKSNLETNEHIKSIESIDFEKKNDSTTDLLITDSSSKKKLEKNRSLSASSISCYLCVKVNKNKDFITCPLDRKMKNRLKSEFWFQINDNSTDKICAFFLEWKNDPLFPNIMPKGRFQLVKQDEKLADLIAENLLSGSSPRLNKSFSSTNRLINRAETFVKDWEIVNLLELESKLKKEIEIEKEYKTLPKLMNNSTILKEEHLRKLNVNLIPRAVGYDWTLSFSTELHGFSLNTLYRTLADVESPCLIVVMDTKSNIFGTMAPCKLHQSEHYYGTGESFLYTFYPSFKVFKWTGENNFFIRGNAEGIGFGCGEGYHGLWFDGDLLNGHTQKSKTYDNEMLTSSEYFTIASIEVWTFSD